MAADRPDHRHTLAMGQTTASGWIQLFNGRNLDGWTPKITGHLLGQNFGNTFRVENGILKVSYDRYPEFANQFGHLFYKDKFSHYILAAEYRFTGEQANGAPAWALRDNGLMLHSQSAESMLLNQNFPISIEVQLLGGAETGERSTANVCTPGTEIFMNGQMVRGYCTNSKSITIQGESAPTEFRKIELLDLSRR